MKFTERDKVLALILPAILVGAGYAWLFGSPKNGEVNKASIALEGARAQAPGITAKLQQVQAQLGALTREVQLLETDKKAAQSALAAATGKCPEHHLRNERIEKLTYLLNRRGLRLLEDSEADASKDGRISPGLDLLVKQVTEPIGQGKPQLRLLRLKGRYLDVLGVLEDLAESEEVIAIPVSLALKNATVGTTEREWVLLVWI